MESIIKDLCAKIETLESKLKMKSSVSFYALKGRNNVKSKSCNLNSSDSGDENVAVTRTSSSKRKRYTICADSDWVPIGDGHAFVPSRLLKNMDWSTHTYATRKLLRAVFPRSVLATHSLTGKPSPAFPNKPAKKRLDPALVNDIVQTVVDNCCVPESVVRASITTKCADESKIFRSCLRKANSSAQEEVESSATAVLFLNSLFLKRRSNLKSTRPGPSVQKTSPSTPYLKSNSQYGSSRFTTRLEPPCKKRLLQKKKTTGQAAKSIVLATHSLTGKPSPAFPNKPAKKRLDPALVNDIVQTVVDNCCVPESVVRTIITTKCADESKMFRSRLRKSKSNSAKIDQENIPPLVCKSGESDESYLST
ncbi:unnamed protein product [Parnassius apollo]|uniref:(apollo) hypothetical protein n=1 Tax=Parnassius apollo TaxID=110799 RepID=A0A8S3WFP4_PARAO|nr:unnamed protein product [Parnassius apollo]